MYLLIYSSYYRYSKAGLPQVQTDNVLFILTAAASMRGACMWWYTCKVGQLPVLPFTVSLCV